MVIWLASGRLWQIAYLVDDAHGCAVLAGLKAEDSSCSWSGRSGVSGQGRSLLYEAVIAGRTVGMPPVPDLTVVYVHPVLTTAKARGWRHGRDQIRYCRH